MAKKVKEYYGEECEYYTLPQKFLRKGKGVKKDEGDTFTLQVKQKVDLNVFYKKHNGVVFSNRTSELKKLLEILDSDISIKIMVYGEVTKATLIVGRKTMYEAVAIVHDGDVYDRKTGIEIAKKKVIAKYVARQKKLMERIELNLAKGFVYVQEQLTKYEV